MKIYRVEYGTTVDNMTTWRVAWFASTRGAETDIMSQRLADSTVKIIGPLTVRSGPTKAAQLEMLNRWCTDG